MHEDSCQIVKWCIDRGLYTGILTNGTIIPGRLLEELSSAIDQIIFSVSLDGATPEAHDRMRGVKGAFRSTVENIRRLVDKGFKVRAAMSVDSESVGDLEKTLLFARELGVMAFSYSAVMPFGRAENSAMTGWNIDSIPDEIKFAEKYKGFLTVMSSETTEEVLTEGCGAGHRSFVMDPWGNVRPCVTFSKNDFIVGNLMDQLPEKVFSNPLIKLLKRMPVPSKEICGNCNYFSFCVYCGLRGMKGSGLAKDCTWAKDPRVQPVLNYFPNIK